MTENSIAPVIVVGAGLSGLACARDLHKQGVQTIVLEARNRIGGRVHSVDTGSGHTVDLGAQWFGPSQKRIQAIIKEADIQCINLKPRGRRISEATAPLSLLDRFNIMRIGFRIHREVRKTPVDRPWLREQVDHLDNTPVTQWLESVGTARAVLTWKHIVEQAYCTDAIRISTLESLHHLATMGGLTALAAAETTYCVKGAVSIAAHLAKDLTMQLNTRVKSVHRDGKLLKIQTNAGAYTAKQVVISAPPQLACDMLSPHDAKSAGLIQSPVIPRVIKTVLVYETEWWRGKGLSGFASSTGGPVNTLMNTPLKDSSFGCLVALSTGNTAQNLPEDSATRNKLIADHVDKLLGGDATPAIAIESINWNTEAFSAGGYASVRPFGSWMDPHQQTCQSKGPIHLAGTETASQWRSYMEGALQSGERAAKNVLAAM